MTIEDHTLIEDWTEADLLDLPASETDDYEYKSSRISENGAYRGELQSKICKAASAFWNTGGGLFVAGVDDLGVIDGGLPRMMGRQKLRDWVDQVLTHVVPVGPYSVRTIEAEVPASRIQRGRVVLVIAFGESFDLPHMAPDHRYYVRSGAHSNPASHYLVEAVRARRGLRRPMLRGLLREHPLKPGIVEMLILAVNDMPALNVGISFEPLPQIFLRDNRDKFPLIVPVIERDTPFRLDVATLQDRAYWFAEQPVMLKLVYQGMVGKQYEERQLLDYQHSLSPVQLPSMDTSPIALTQIATQLQTLNSLLETYLKQATNEP